MRKRQASKNHKRIELQSGPSTSSQNAGGDLSRFAGWWFNLPEKKYWQIKDHLKPTSFVIWCLFFNPWNRVLL